MGGDFVEAIGEALLRVDSAPLRYPVVYRDIRRALVQQFRFSIFYKDRERPDHRPGHLASVS